MKMISYHHHRSIFDFNYGVLCHAVNCRGKMGAGLALEMRNRFPEAYKEYMNDFKSGFNQLGNITVVNVAPSLYIAHLYTQYNYGRDKRYTDYDAMEKCFKKLKGWKEIIQREAPGQTFPVYIPYKIGCSLGGGDWAVVEKLISKTFNTTPVNIVSKFGAGS